MTNNLNPAIAAALAARIMARNLSGKAIANLYFCNTVNQTLSAAITLALNLTIAREQKAINEEAFDKACMAMGNK